MSLVHNDFTKVTLRNHSSILEEKSIFVVKAIALVLGLALGNPNLHLLEICPRGNNKLVIIILYFIVHDNRLLSMLELY